MPYFKGTSKRILVFLLAISCFLLSGSVFSQSISTRDIQQQPPLGISEQNAVPKPKSKPNVDMPHRTINRIGTAIGVRNSISIKSTDAGIIHRQRLPASGCVNCGVVDFVNVIRQGNGLNAIAGGVIAGTVARKIGGYGSHEHANTNRNTSENVLNGRRLEHNTTDRIMHYDVGITMNDGSQATITLPDASQFHRGDKVQLIDGALVPHR